MITWDIDHNGTLTVWRDQAEVVRVALPEKERIEMILCLLHTLEKNPPLDGGGSLSIV